MYPNEQEISELAGLIWETSRKDEGTISATGANIIARVLMLNGYRKVKSKPTLWQRIKNMR